MQYCSKCIYPETQDTLLFDETGTCSVCRQIEYRDEQIDFTARRRELDELIGRYRNKGQYDCIVPFSGGKDSTFQAWYVVRELGLKPLLVRFDHWFYRPLVHENNTRTMKQLGVEMLNFTPNWQVVRELMLEALVRRGDFCWHCHTGVYAYPMQVAVRYDIPLIIWGESLAEYQSFYAYDEMEEVDEKRFNRAMNLGVTADDMYEFLGGRVERRDLLPFTYPRREELKRIGCRSVCLGSYIKWDTKKQVEIIKRELGWKGQKVEGIPEQYDYEKIECMMQGIRDYLKFIKRGFGRTNHLANIDIRNKRMSRDEGFRLAMLHDGQRPASLDVFLEFLQLTEDEFMRIALTHQVSPHQHDASKVTPGEPLPDMGQWDRTKVEKPVGPPRDAEGQVERVLVTGIVDYGMGNVESVFQALAFLDEPAKITADPAKLHECDRLVLPGVGAFGDAMTKLHDRGLVDVLDREVRHVGKPLLGICLGMQLLGRSSTEHGEHAGFGWIDADIVRFSVEGQRLKVPHMGWNDVAVRGGHWLFSGLKPEHSVFYFVHSYHMVCHHTQDIAAECDYGGPFVAAVSCGNVAATQFHPEKSQDSGLHVLRNFLAWRP